MASVLVINGRTSYGDGKTPRPSIPVEGFDRLLFLAEYQALIAAGAASWVQDFPGGGVLRLVPGVTLEEALQAATTATALAKKL